MDDAHSLMQDEWQRALAKDQAKATELFGHSEEEQRRLGYFHTIREICQQPWTWLRTCDRMLDSRDGLNERSEEHTSELQSRLHLVCRLLLEKKKKVRETTMSRESGFLSSAALYSSSAVCATCISICMPYHAVKALSVYTSSPACTRTSASGT